MDLQNLKYELQFRTSRSSGSGGQHVNKVATKVELLFDIPNSQELTDKQKQLIRKNLQSRLTTDGILSIVNQESRSQFRNKKAAIERFFVLIEKALIPPKKRKKVLPLTADSKKRLAFKKRLAEKKTLRQKIHSNQL